MNWSAKNGRFLTGSILRCPHSGKKRHSLVHQVTTGDCLFFQFLTSTNCHITSCCLKVLCRILIGPGNVYHILSPLSKGNNQTHLVSQQASSGAISIVKSIASLPGFSTLASWSLRICWRTFYLNIVVGKQYTKLCDALMLCVCLYLFGVCMQLFCFVCIFICLLFLSICLLLWVFVLFFAFVHVGVFFCFCLCFACLWWRPVFVRLNLSVRRLWRIRSWWRHYLLPNCFTHITFSNVVMCLWIIKCIIQPRWEC